MASQSESPAYLAAQLASRSRLWICESPIGGLISHFIKSEGLDESVLNPVTESPNWTPASASRETADLPSGGPSTTSFFSHASGAARALVSIYGICAAASSLAT